MGNQHSDFWMKDYDIDWDFTDESDDLDTSNAQTETTAHLIRLAAARRAISNYVSILTSKNVPVMFNDQNVSMTDGKTVYIGADVNEKNNFDVAVGLALHEGSHICYSDFDLYKTLWQKVPREIYDYASKLNISKEEVANVCKTLFNIIEDRYIDYTIYKNAPGYRGYYEALYDKYFNTSVIDDGLKSDLYRTLNTESYLYRIINITNAHTDLNALPGLYEIAKTLNLTDIVRLKTGRDRLDCAFEIVTIIFKNINAEPPKPKIEVQTDMPASGNGDQKESSESQTNISKKSAEKSSEKKDSEEKDSKSEDDILGGDTTGVESTDEPNSKDNIGDDKSISQTKKIKIAKAFQKQKEFVAGNIKKKKVSKKENQVLNVLERSQIDLVDVGADYVVSQNNVGAIECILVKNLTRELATSEEFPLGPARSWYGYKDVSSIPQVIDLQKIIDQGISLGVKIGKRLQFRNEVNIEKFSRRETGRLDKRIIHELGFDAKNIFYTTVTSKYKKINFHISVDASASMRGNKWRKTMLLCTAIAKAASMLENIHVTISFRSTMDKMSYVVMAYDSNKDKISKVKSLFAYIHPDGLTPEGLSFEAIMKEMPESGSETDSYFINISDGEPCFSFNGESVQNPVGYSGADAASHTRKQVNKIRNMNYKVISYFINESNELSPQLTALFKTMYGKDSVFINVENLNQIVNTLNKKMLESVDV
tara:strand:- start:1309 stop:3435 length:2127 start_codon:yes stop_codon:yes gene_type:complete